MCAPVHERSGVPLFLNHTSSKKPSTVSQRLVLMAFCVLDSAQQTRATRKKDTHNSQGSRGSPWSEKGSGSPEGLGETSMFPLDPLAAGGISCFSSARLKKKRHKCSLNERATGHLISRQSRQLPLKGKLDDAPGTSLACSSRLALLDRRRTPCICQNTPPSPSSVDNPQTHQL